MIHTSANATSEENINLVGWLPHLKATQRYVYVCGVAVVEFEPFNNEEKILYLSLNLKH
jgi:hypothetical protein